MGHYWVGIMWLNVIGFSPWTSMCLFLFVCFWRVGMVYLCILISLTPSSRFTILFTISKNVAYMLMSLKKVTNKQTKAKPQIFVTLDQRGNLLLTIVLKLYTEWWICTKLKGFHLNHNSPQLRLDGYCSKRQQTLLKTEKDRRKGRLRKWVYTCWGQLENYWKLHLIKLTSYLSILFIKALA